MAYTYSVPPRDASIQLTPSRMPLAAAAHLGLPWGTAVDALRASVIAARAHLVASDYPAASPLQDDLALEVIDLVGQLDRHDRYLFRLLFAMLYRGAISKARNGNGHHHND
jgi:hypothetical protein